MSLAILALEAGALFALARRWLGAEAAAVAVMVDLVSALTFMRARSLLSWQALPLELLVVALLAGRVRGPRSALLWGALLPCLALDYEGAVVAAPFLAACCLAQEPLLRRQWRWALAGAAAAAAALLALSAGQIPGYLHRRIDNSLTAGAADGSLAGAWLGNLRGLLLGGGPQAYLGVSAWPALAPWAWPLLALGAVAAWRGRAWALLAWAGGAVALLMASRASSGLPVERLAAVWPALCLLAGLGWERYGAALGPRRNAWLALAVCLGLASEANAFLRHMAVVGRATYGRAELLEQGCREGAALARADGGAFQGSWYGTAQPQWSLQAASLPARDAAAPRRVLVPAGFRAALRPQDGALQVLRRSPNDEPLLLLTAQGAAARRWDRLEAQLQPLFAPGAGAAQRRAFLAEAGHDPLAFSAVLAWQLRWDEEFDPFNVADWSCLARERGAATAALDAAARILAGSDPAHSEALARLALTRDPLDARAWHWLALGLQRQGRSDEAQAARDAWARHWRDGAWMSYD